MKSWIDKFIAETKGLGIPETFTKWGAIWAVSTAMERRVWMYNARGRVYPNLFVFMIAPPGIGKTEVEKILRPILADNKLKLSAQHVSKASLIDELNAAKRSKMIKGAGRIKYHSLALLTSEFIETFPEYNVQFLGMLAHWWDAPDIVQDAKRHLEENIEIRNTSTTLLAGVQPGVLAHAFPIEAWNGGFLARVIPVYFPDKVEFMLRGQHAEEKVPVNIKGLTNSLGELMAQGGEMLEDDTLLEAYLDWKVTDKQLPRPRHPRLKYYNDRREHQLEKLSMIAAFAEGRMVVTGEDYTLARSWLEGTEHNVDSIFLEMASGDQLADIKDLHMFMVAKTGINRPVPVADIKRFLARKIPAQQIASFLDLACQANFIEKKHKGKFYTAKTFEDIGDVI